MAATQVSHDVIALGARFLCRAQQDDGRWSDFETLAGPCDEWVTAIVLSSLAALPGPLAGELDVDRAVGSASDWLRSRQRPDGGWGYSALVPSDADSTSHARAALALVSGPADEVLERADSFLARHEDAEGRLHTYADEAGIRAYTGVDDSISFAGWTSAHPCVTAYAASTLPLNRCRGLADALRRWQATDGSWPAYWWSDRTPATRWAAEAVARCSESAADRDALARAEGWLRQRGRELVERSSEFPDGTVYPLSHVVAALLAVGSSAVCLELLVDHLRALQGDDGSWPSSARLRIPPPDMVEPDLVTQWSRESGGGSSINSDVRCVVTTATAVAALARHASHLVPPVVGP